jgi:transcription initiation factor IIE alpha subunit
MMDRHKSGNTVIGPHITRIYGVGVSFTDKTLADKLCSSKKENKKILAYLAEHANNGIFLTPLQLYAYILRK